MGHECASFRRWNEERPCSQAAVPFLNCFLALFWVALSCTSPVTHYIARWVLLRKAVLGDGHLQKDPDALAVFESLVGLPTLYETDVNLVKQAVRQNVKGTYVQPLSCLQWAHLALMEKFPVHETWHSSFEKLYCLLGRRRRCRCRRGCGCGCGCGLLLLLLLLWLLWLSSLLLLLLLLVVVYTEDAIGQDYSQIFSWDDPVARRQTGKQLCAKFEEILAGYHAEVDAEGVVVDAPAAKKRKGRRQRKQLKRKLEVARCQMIQWKSKLEPWSSRQWKIFWCTAPQRAIEWCAVTCRTSLVVVRGKVLWEQKPFHGNTSGRDLHLHLTKSRMKLKKLPGDQQLELQESCCQNEWRVFVWSWWQLTTDNWQLVTSFRFVSMFFGGLVWVWFHLVLQTWGQPRCTLAWSWAQRSMNCFWARSLPFLKVMPCRNEWPRRSLWKTCGRTDLLSNTGSAQLICVLPKTWMLVKYGFIFQPKMDVSWYFVFLVWYSSLWNCQLCSRPVQLPDCF